MISAQQEVLYYLKEFQKPNDPPITPSTRLVADLGMDSLDLLEAVMTLEDEYHLEIPDEAIETVKTVGNLFDLVKVKFHPDVDVDVQF